MREQITIRNRAASSQSSFGSPTFSVSTLATGVWCSVRTIRSDEVFLDQERKSRTVKEFRLRYVTGILETGSIVHGSAAYDIKSIENVNERDRELIILGESVT